MLDKQRGDRGVLLGDRLRWALELIDFALQSLNFGRLLTAEVFEEVGEKPAQSQVPSPMSQVADGFARLSTPQTRARLECRRQSRSRLAPFRYWDLGPVDMGLVGEVALEEAPRRGGVGNEIDALHGKDFLDDRRVAALAGAGLHVVREADVFGSVLGVPQELARPARFWG